MPRTYEIHTKGDGDPVVVQREPTRDTVCLEYTDEDGNQVWLPWAQVDRVVSYRTPDRDEFVYDAETGVRVGYKPGEAPEGEGVELDAEDGDEPEDEGKASAKKAAPAKAAAKKAAAAQKAAPAGSGDSTPADPKGSKASEWAEADPAKVREWAKAQGKDVGDSGPIPKDVLSAYSAAHS